MEFRGRTSCGAAAGRTDQEAVNTAKGIACSDIASGRAESLTPPAQAFRHKARGYHYQKKFWLYVPLVFPSANL